MVIIFFILVYLLVRVRKVVFYQDAETHNIVPSHSMFIPPFKINKV